MNDLSSAHRRTELATVFHALADPNRMLIVAHLATGEHRVRDLVDHLGLAQSTVSAHLACLRECGLVTYRVQGRSSWYSSVHIAGIADVLAAATALLGHTATPNPSHQHALEEHT